MQKTLIRLSGDRGVKLLNKLFFKSVEIKHIFEYSENEYFIAKQRISVGNKLDLNFDFIAVQRGSGAFLSSSLSPFFKLLRYNILKN